MVEQTGEEIDWDRCPPDIEDFPDTVITAMSIYSKLGDRIYPDVGFIGKDFTNLSLMFDLYYINSIVQKDYITEMLLVLDAQHIKESQEQIKAQYDRIKKK